ncbi:MFS transporter [Streptomyces gilvosporeus]|uniref:MFS transporter n=2 Tax=Streptomyces gilvosporeus TaxID=553510 RepID=A0A1V0U389_9ACTN|nr:MFS transporter [Streptomyces gilvosporeus]
MALSVLVNMLGWGIYLTAGVLYFTRSVRLPAAQVGIGLSVAGAVALAAGVPVGHLADRRGARGVYAGTLALGAVAMAGLCLARSFWSFLLCASLAAVAQTSGPAARGPLIQRYGGDRPAAFRAYLRAVANVGISVGALLAGWAAQTDTPSAYLLLIAGSAATWAAGATLVLFLPAAPPVRSAPGPRWTALRDRPYLLLTVLDGIMAMQYRVLTAAVPLWLVDRTAAPRWSVSGVMLVNTALVVLFQVRMSRTVDTARAGGIAFRRAGYAFLAACVLLSVLPGLPAWLTLTLLAAAVVAHTAGELWQVAGGFELSFALAPAHAVGQYQGLFGMGSGLGVAIGPVVLITLCVEWGMPGWWLVGALFAVTGLLTPAAVRWAEREGEREGERTTANPTNPAN